MTSLHCADTAASPTFVRYGLEGVLAADTELSHVDGERGRLIIAGHDIEELASWARFEDVCALLSRSESPAVDAAGWEQALGHGRVKAFGRLTRLGDALTLRDGMDALRASVAHLPDDSSPAEIIASIAVFAAAWARTRSGLAPIAPDASRSHARDLLSMFGLSDGSARARALDAYLVTVSDHGFNASTFAARVVASTRSDLVSAVVAAIGALKGPLHGGAPGPVLDLLELVGAPERAAPVIERELAEGRRIMGMGHRIYRVRDPRASVLERAIEVLERELSRESGAEAAHARARLDLARSVEKTAEALLGKRHPTRPLRANVEFYTAVLLDALGFERAAFALVFAVARSAGWVAHVGEERRTGRLIRPSARYVGHMPDQSA